MGGFTVGPWFETLGNISLVAFGLGACTGYLLVIGDYATEVMVILLRTTEGEGMAGAEGHESCAHPRPALCPCACVRGASRWNYQMNQVT